MHVDVVVVVDVVILLPTLEKLFMATHAYTYTCMDIPTRKRRP